MTLTEDVKQEISSMFSLSKALASGDAEAINEIAKKFAGYATKTPEVFLAVTEIALDSPDFPDGFKESLRAFRDKFTRMQEIIANKEMSAGDKIIAVMALTGNTDALPEGSAIRVTTDIPNWKRPMCPSCNGTMKFVGRDISKHDGRIFDTSQYECVINCGGCLGLSIQNHMNADGSLKENYKPEIAV